MPTRKNIKSKKSNKGFRKTRSKKQTRKSNKRFRKTRSKRGGAGSGTPEPAPEPCPICLFDVNVPVNTDPESVIQVLGPPVTTACGHKFHAYCLRRWCRQHRNATTCPVCREAIGLTSCIELLFTDLEKKLFDAINAERDENSFHSAENALAEGLNEDGTSRYDNNNIQLLDINVKNADGNTPLILAVINNETDIVKILLNYGADVDAVNNNGYTAGTESHDEEIDALLLEVMYPDLHDPLDDAVEAAEWEAELAANRGGKRKQKKGKQKV